jgi:hypothetical protein
MLLAATLDCYGEDYPELFLDEQGDLRADVAVRLKTAAASVVDGQLSMWSLNEVFEEWVGLASSIMDGYELHDLAEVWSNASEELGEGAAWPGPALTAFFAGLVGELDRYLVWQCGGRYIPFGPADDQAPAVALYAVEDGPGGADTRSGPAHRVGRVSQVPTAGGGQRSPRAHETRLAEVLDMYGEECAGLFLDEHGDLRGDVAIRLRSVVTSVAFRG